MSKVLFIIGTRPEITKIAPVANNIKSKILFTGQHFSKNMSSGFFNLIESSEIINLNLKKFKYFQNNERYLVDEVAKFIKKINIDKIVVQGDTNSTLVGSIAAKILKKKLFFIEAGMRSFDITQPEEYNRVLVSHLADLNFCNHFSNRKNLITEGVDPKKILVTGSTVYSSVKLIDKSIEDTENKEYILCTLHRPENVDEKEKLISLLKTINSLNYQIIFPLHPRTKKTLLKNELIKFSNIKFIPPKKYEEFLNLIKFSNFIISDSGGLQEEAAIYRKPLIIPRKKTERPELLHKFNILTKNNKELYKESKKLLMKNSNLIKSVRKQKYIYGKDEVIKNIVNGIEQS